MLLLTDFPSCFRVSWLRYFKDPNSNICYSCSKSATETIEITEDNPSENETLASVFSCKFCEIFKNIFFTEHFQVTASAIRMQVVVICNLHLSLQFCNDKLNTLL